MRRPQGHIDYADPVVRDHPLNKGLAAWWLSLPGVPVGGKLTELVAKRHGTLSGGPAAGPGTPSGFPAPSFDGSDDYADAGDLSVVDSAAAGYVWSAWIKVNFDSSTLQKMILGKDDNASGRQFYWAYGNSGGADRLEFGMFSSDASHYISRVAVSLSLNDGRWHFVTFRFAPGIATYHGVDGVETASGALDTNTSWTGTMQATSASLNIGRRSYSGFTQNWQGGIADVRYTPLPVASSTWHTRALYQQSRQGHPDLLRRQPLVAKAPAPAAGNRRRRVLLCGGN